MASRGPKQMITESAVIVGSILLAFAIDAGWEHRGERRQLERLTVFLEADLEATQEAIRARSAWAEEVASNARKILMGIANRVEGEELDALVSSIGNVFVKAEWIPINHTYEQALGAGDLSLIEDPKIRLLLGRYSEELDNFRSTQNDVITQYYGQLEPFLVANTNYSQVAWEGEADGLVQVPFTTDAAALATRRDFANLLNLKLELELELVSDLAKLHKLSDELLEELRSSRASGSKIE